MGQKVNPTALRLGINQTWVSKWYSDKRDFAGLLEQDVKLRRFLKHKLKEAGIDRLEIERSRGEVTVTITVAKPGLVIGRGGTGIEELKKTIIAKYLSPKTNLKVNITEVDKPNLSPGAVLQGMITDIEKRIPFRRVMKQNIEKVMRAGAEGVKVMMSGRLNGAEIARRETLSEGKIPLHTLRANIEYARGAAFTTYGAVGIKIWIYKGLKFDQQQEQAKAEEAPKKKGTSRK